MSTHRIVLDEQPCVVVHVDEWDMFLVGTYMFNSPNSAYNAKNNRDGSLMLFGYSHLDQKYNLIDRIKCDDGGVFDLTVDNDSIHVAHANNAVGVYRFDAPNRLNENPSGLPLESRGKYLSHLVSEPLSSDTSILVTSIDQCHLGGGNGDDEKLLAVADSDGRVTILKRTYASRLKILDKTYVMEDKDAKAPVWQVRFIQPTKAEMTNLDQLYLIFCCENGTWNLLRYHIKTSAISRLRCIFRDHAVGVTSACILKPPEDSNRFETMPQYLDLIIGSYDETVRKYRLEIKTLNLVGEEEIIVKPECVEKVKIEGAGVWRMVLKKGTLYMANMFAGCHKSSASGIASTLVNLTDRILTDVETEEPALLYGIDVAPNGVACVVDYNNKSVTFCEL